MAFAAVFLALLAISSTHADVEREFDFATPIYSAAGSQPYRRHLMQQGSPLPNGGYPSPSPDGAGQSPSPSPEQPSPSPEGAGESPSPAPSVTVCKGVAYDGYLSNCQLSFKAPGSQDLATTATVLNGRFDTQTTADQLGAGYLTPAPLNTPATPIPAGEAAGFCFDTTTRLPEYLPLATVAPSDCSKPVVVDIATTLLQYGLEAGIKAAATDELFSADAVRKAFGFSDNIVFGQYDAIAASKDAATAGEGLAALKAQTFMRNCLQIIAQSFTKDSQAFAKVAKQVFVALSQYTMDTRERRLLPATRRLQQGGQTERLLDFTQPSELSGLIAAVEGQITDAVAAGDLDATMALQSMNDNIKQAIADAVATINVITASSTSFTELQKAAQVVLTTLTGRVVELVAAGPAGVAAFQASTSEASLRAAVEKALLAGEEVPPEPEEGGSSNKGALIGGLVGGLGGGLLLILLVAGIILYRRRRNGRAQ